MRQLRRRSAQKPQLDCLSRLLQLRSRIGQTDLAIAARALNSLARICGPKRARIKVGLLVALRLFEKRCELRRRRRHQEAAVKVNPKKKFPRFKSSRSPNRENDCRSFNMEKPGSDLFRKQRGRQQSSASPA